VQQHQNGAQSTNVVPHLYWPSFRPTAPKESVLHAGKPERNAVRPAKKTKPGEPKQTHRAAAELRTLQAAAIAQHGMAHDGVVDFLEGDDALAAARKVVGQKAQKLAKNQRPLQHEVGQLAKPKRALDLKTTASRGQAPVKRKAKLRVSVAVAKRKRT